MLPLHRIMDAGLEKEEEFNWQIEVFYRRI
jgi:hypothetical protein